MIVGIDLGTTNSLIAYFDGEKPVVIPNRLGKMLTPSVVSIDEEGTTYVGETARVRGMTHPEETASCFKRSMGTKREYRLGNRVFSATELSALVLKYLKEDAETWLGEPVTEAVISVPAYFNDAQRRATKQAGEMAGFRVERIVSEPTSAAISYGCSRREGENRYLVFDLGGGTFDVSVLEYSDGIMEVRAVAGDNFLGGEDFTVVLEKLFLRREEIAEASLSPKELSLVHEAAEKAKIAFSDAKKTEMRVTLQGKEIVRSFTLEEYEQACQILLGRIRKPIERSLKDADVRLADITEVLLVGGATRLSLVKRFVGRLFGRIPNGRLNPDQVVAEGAAIEAAMKERREEVKELILTDVCPFTLGTEICVTRAGGNKENGHYLPIIERNTVIPVSRTHRVYTANDGQSALRVTVLQGESRQAANNLLLGELEIPVPVAAEGKECADITFTYDVNSILEVIVKVISTGEERRMIIKNEQNGLSDEEVEDRLAELASLKIPPREQESNKLLLAEGNRMYEEAVGSVRNAIEREMNLFEAALDTQDKKKYGPAAERLSGFLELIRKRQEIGEDLEDE